MGDGGLECDGAALGEAEEMDTGGRPVAVLHEVGQRGCDGGYAGAWVWVDDWFAEVVERGVPLVCIFVEVGYPKR